MKHASMFHRVQSGELSTEAFERQLASYKRQKLGVARMAHTMEFDTFQGYMHDLDLSISITQLFIENFNAIKRGKK